MVEYYDREGKPISLHEFGRLHNNLEYCRVAEDFIGPARVSTVWLGLDHSLSLFVQHIPQIFETMIFGGPWDLYQWRYATEASALAGHDQIVAALKNDEEPSYGR